MSEHFKPEWTEAYANYSLKILPGMEIVCAWPTLNNEKGYEVSFCGRRLLKRFEGIEEAKAAGIRLAERVLKQAEGILATVAARRKEDAGEVEPNGR